VEVLARFLVGFLVASPFSPEVALPSPKRFMIARYLLLRTESVYQFRRMKKGLVWRIPFDAFERDEYDLL